MLPILAAVIAATDLPPVRAAASARVSVVILQPHRASRQTWDPASRRNQREVVKKEPGGAEVRLRLTEFE